MPWTTCTCSAATMLTRRDSPQNCSRNWPSDWPPCTCTSTPWPTTFRPPSSPSSWSSRFSRIPRIPSSCIHKISYPFQTRVRAGALCPSQPVRGHEAEGTAPADFTLPEAQRRDDGILQQGPYTAAGGLKIMKGFEVF